MKPTDIQQVGEELAIKWDDGAEQFVSLKNLRLHCPCAGCQGEQDVMGNIYKPRPQQLLPTSFQLLKIQTVGGYAVQPVWNDGHATGIYSFEYLRRLSDLPA